MYQNHFLNTLSRARTVKDVIDLKDHNLNEQKKIIRKQEVLIYEMTKFMGSKEDFRNSLGEN